jgi:succinoglycan biosynthesis transport protein ExoP
MNGELRAWMMLHESDNHLESEARVIPLPAMSMPSQGDDTRIDLKELIHVIKRRRNSILWAAAIPTIAALLYGLAAQPLYTASTQLLIDPRDRKIISNEVSPEGLAPDGGIAVVESQLLVVTSDTVLRRVIAREDLGTDPEFGGPASGLTAALYRAAGSFGVDMDRDSSDPVLKALRTLKKRVGAKRSDKAYVVDIYVTTTTRDKSVRIADGIAQGYLEDQASARAAASANASAALGGRLDALRARVQEAENRVVSYKEQHKIVVAGGVLVSEQQLSDVTVQLSTARAKTAEARARYEQITRAKQMGFDTGANPEAVLSQTIGQLRAQYADAMRQRAQLGAMVGPKHPSIANLDAQTASIRKLIEEELTRITTAARSDVERAHTHQQSLERELERLKTTAGETDQASVRLRELEREAETSRAVYQAFLTRARETGEQQSIDNTNARVISKATPPRDNSWPPRFLIAALALIGGLGVGTGVGLMREYFDERIYSGRALQSAIGVAILAVLPAPTQRNGRWAKLNGALPLRRRTGNSETLREGDTAALIAAMRLLRDRLFRQGRPKPGRSILVTSATPHEGHSIVALNLALTAAADGWRVLLIDADMKLGALSKALDAAENTGLLDLLAGRAALASTVIHETDTGLSFLPVGKATTDLANVSQGLQTVTQREGFDLTIIDGGTMLGSEHSRALAGIVDDIVLVVRAGGPTRTEIRSALDTLALSSRKVRGAVLSGASDDIG